ncbi:MAG: transcriptional repressor [Polyangiaceae bacterium]|nr:transcriptional repressor [Polyangiaceae bacterium]
MTRPTKSSAQAFRDRLRGSGLRATSARVAVYKVLSEAETPLSHAEVCALIGDEGFDRATIYRNLVDLGEAGLLKRTDVGDHVWRFELTGDEGIHSSEVHPHFVCTDCGGVACLPEGSVVVRAVRGAPRSLGAPVEVHVRGICDACG